VSVRKVCQRQKRKEERRKKRHLGKQRVFLSIYLLFLLSSFVFYLQKERVFEAVQKVLGVVIASVAKQSISFLKFCSVRRIASCFVPAVAMTEAILSSFTVIYTSRGLVLCIILPFRSIESMHKILPREV
jgi:glucan phosphoethanolaminetransferase (alkaline phosphatase superfamily)